jgi:hypothetical protein
MKKAIKVEFETHYAIIFLNDPSIHIVLGEPLKITKMVCIFKEFQEAGYEYLDFSALAELDLSALEKVDIDRINLLDRQMKIIMELHDE